MLPSFFLEVDFMQKIIHLKDLISCMLDTFLFEYEVKLRNSFIWPLTFTNKFYM